MVALLPPSGTEMLFLGSWPMDYESVFFKGENITPLSLDDQNQCDGPITEAECINAINGFTKIKRRVPTVFLLNSTNFSGPNFEPKCYQAFILPFKHDHSRSVNAEELFLSFPKKTKTNHY